MSKKVRVSILYGAESSIAKVVQLGLRVSSGKRVTVCNEYEGGLATGEISLAFRDQKTADEFRCLAKTTYANIISGIDGSSIGNHGAPVLRTGVGSPAGMSVGLGNSAGGRRRTIHEENLAYWSADRFNASKPKPARRRIVGIGPSFSQSQPVTLSQGAFESKAVDSASYASLPFSAVGKLNFTGVDWQTCSGVTHYSGSAWVIAPRVIMTVAHNLYEVGCSDESSNIIFRPGFNGSSSETYSVVSFKYVSEYAGDPPGVTPNPAAVNDVGICILDREVSGSIGMIPPLTNATSLPDHILAIGYPGNHDNGQSMWSCRGEYMPDLSSSDDVVMASDFGGGSSGGPWVIETSEGWKSIGAQVGIPSGQSGDYSVSAAFGSQVNDLVTWANSIVSSL